MRGPGIIAATILCLLHASCGGGTGPFRNLLVCLHNAREVQEYGEFVERYAGAAGMTYTDNTETMAYLTARHNPAEVYERSKRESIVSVVESNFGFRFLVSNWDHAETTVAHSFLATSELDRAVEWTDQFVAQVKTRWDVYELPVAEYHYPPSCEEAQALLSEDR